MEKLTFESFDFETTDAAALMRFCVEVYAGFASAEADAIRFFGDSHNGAATGAYLTLARFSGAKAMAIQHRLIGEIPTAQEYECACEDYYRSLPDFARW